jgi:hypothetical protein
LPIGDQQPRICHVPEYVSSAGQEAVELARMAGLHLDPWQEFELAHSLGERRDGKWAAFEVAQVVPRQNGKDSVLEARELAGLFLLGERLLIHSAHQFDTSLEHFRRLLFLIESTPDFDKRVMQVKRSHGEEGIELIGGQRIRFRTRTKGGGRGFSGDFLALNEAMELPESTVGALMPTLSARPNPQLWYAASPVDQEHHEHGIVLARVRERALKGDPSLAYFEHSAEAESPEFVTDDMATDPDVWAQANPGLGIRISFEHVEREQRSMDPRTFAVERLGVGDWPSTDGIGRRKIDPHDWARLIDKGSKPKDPVAFALDVTPDRSAAAIGVAGTRVDDRTHVEVVEHRRGTGWAAHRAAELVESHNALGLVLDAAGPAASLLPALAELGVKVEVVNSREHAQACGLLYDAADQDRLRHLGTQELSSAIAGAVTRPLGDAWAWSRRSSSIDISPLVACTLALWGLETLELPETEAVGTVY